MSPSEKALRLRARKGHAPISALTAYDYPTARLLDEAGVDLLLVGDSLGMVVLGFPDTTHVTLDHMIHHTAAVARGSQNAFIVGDLPIHTYPDPVTALTHARLLVEAGAHAVKLEGGLRQAEKVAAITADGIPVVGHLGMLPQRVKEEGGYKKKCKTDQETQALLEGALALQEAGISALVLESVLPAAARHLTDHLEIPTIGIGCGRGNCDGEIAVITDVIGSYPWFVPPFATPRADVAGEITRAVQGYLDALTGS
jgi:3-methyl-2-oxobutanoate hydroxymethyltransferase